MTRLAGTNVLITGAAGGFGREMVRQFSAAGSRLIVTDLHLDSLKARVAEVRADLPATAGEVLAFIAADLSTAEGCEELYEGVQNRDLSVDILVNNAGIAQFGLFHEAPGARWENVLAINLLAPMRLSRLFLPAMLARGRGHLVNISSVAGWTAAPGIASYNASKFGLRGFGESMAAELEGKGVFVSNVYPFFSRTPILDSPNHGNLPRPEVPDRMIGDPAKVVEAILRGIRRNRLHIFTDHFGRFTHAMVRWAPWALRWLRKGLEKRLANKNWTKKS